MEPPGRPGQTSCEAVRAQTSAKAPGKQVERSGADVSGRVGGERLQERRGAIRGLGRAREVGEDFADFAGILDGEDQAQAPATSRAGEDVNLEGTLHEPSPGPVSVRLGTLPPAELASVRRLMRIHHRELILSMAIEWSLGRKPTVDEEGKA